MIAFATAVAQAEELLIAHALGESMEPLYARLPDVVKGYVELVYDYYSRPSLRFDEGLLYRSPYYKPELQTVSVFTLDNDECRTFATSTPRPRSQDLCEIRVPFNDDRLTKLFAMDVEPCERANAHKLLHDLGVPAAACNALLEPARPPQAIARPSKGLHLRNFGHACIFFDDGKTTVLVDPFLSAQANQGAPRYTFADLPTTIDYALVTHAHIDHFVVETLMRLRHRVRTLIVPRNLGLCYADVSLRRVAQQLGYCDVREVATGDTIRFPDGEILITPFWGEHGDVAHGNKCTYLLRFGTKRALIFADAQALEPRVYQRLRAEVGTIDTVFMNTETEGALLTWHNRWVFPPKRTQKLDMKRRCRGSNKSEALALLEALGAKSLVNYAMGLEPWTWWILGPSPPPTDVRFTEADALMAEVRARGGRAQRLNGMADIDLTE
jgi:L-ascorbate metabolism protein UlaG (beta-lactamase superfamily)